MKNLIFFFAVILLAIYGCHKERSDELSEQNVAGINGSLVASKLTNGDWKLTSVKLKYDDGTLDSAELDACKTDDVFLYEQNGDATVTFGSNMCSIDPANGKFAKWELIENGNKLREEYTRNFLGESAGSIVIYTVDFINDKKLILSRTVTEPGKSYVEISVYIK